MPQENMSSLTSSKRPESECIAEEHASDDEEVELLLKEQPKLRELLSQAEEELLRLIPDAEFMHSCDGYPHFKVLIVSVASKSMTYGQVFDVVEGFAETYYQSEHTMGAPILIIPEC
jgi:hypothetical protein